jgi:DNA-binding transcriptional regulator PaaX
MFRWEFAILEVISGLGGNGCLQEIYIKREEFYPLSEHALRETVYGGRPAYQHQVRSHISNLCEKGDLVRLERGCYSLTENGRRRFLDERDGYGP